MQSIAITVPTARTKLS